MRGVNNRDRRVKDGFSFPNKVRGVGGRIN